VVTRSWTREDRKPAPCTCFILHSVSTHFCRDVRCITSGLQLQDSSPVPSRKVALRLILGHSTPLRRLAEERFDSEKFSAVKQKILRNWLNSWALCQHSSLSRTFQKPWQKRYRSQNPFAVGGLNFWPLFIYRTQVELEPKKRIVYD